MAYRMETGNLRGPSRANTFDRSESERFENITEDGDDGYTTEGERRGTFGKPVRASKTNDSRLRQATTLDELEGIAAEPVGHFPGAVKGQGEANGVPNDVEMQHDTAERPPQNPTTTAAAARDSKAAEVYTLSYLVFFAIIGTLAREGLQALTTYPAAPVSFGVLWANVGGSLVMGFLAEDRKLFRYERGTATYDEGLREAREGNGNTLYLAAAKKAHLATKKTIPLYIGLATGFCGSFTSFSSFIRDVFLAMSNDLPASGGITPGPRNGGYSFMAMLAVVIATVGLSISALFVGAHLAAALEPIVPSVPYPLGRRVMDRGVVVLGWGCWLGAVLLSIWPPYDVWRGQTVFSVVFAPLGCLGRYYTSKWLNLRVPSFPLGTFVVNIFGVAVLGMCWDLGHVGLGGVVGCQVLQGVEDGFCGCLTTVSTWVAELTTLRRRHAYTYGATSVVVGLAVMVLIMGALKWSSNGFGPLMCTH
ncbi:Fluoride export protein 1 [Colletotrichum spinosum]|uniref:Fluoride export protein 1 n=1 Tax=Colletotrichum spinosum TaxID=1347390 RepID=A0A4R8PXP1_9PEZI|nr:Fluoride export protein 1 [Colletotrichum spinosum]